MSTVTKAQIFQIVNGIDEYIKSNLSLAQCIKDSLEQVLDLSDVAPFNVNMAYSGGSAITSSSINSFTSSMITVTNTFITACATAIQANIASKSEANPDFTFLNTTFAASQVTFISEFTNYLTTFTLTYDMVEQPSWLTSDTDVVGTSITGVTLNLYTKSDQKSTNIGVMTDNQLRRYARIIKHLVNCYVTVGIIVAGTKGKYSNNSSYSSTAIATITSNFTNLLNYINTVSNDGNEWLNAFDDWYTEAREGALNIDYQQASLLSSLNTWRNDFGRAIEGPVTAVTLTNAGSGYSVGDIITISFSGATSAVAVVTTIGTGGAVATVSIVNPGANFTTGDDVTVSVTTNDGSTASSGSGLDIDITSSSDSNSLLAYINTMNTSLSS